jgi:conjugal transfer/entry exclusion protein
MLDLGLVAEEVAAVEPLLTTTNTNGQVEGVKYDRVGVVLINVVKEQQKTIEVQGSKLKVQSEELSLLRDEVKSEKAKGKKQADQFEKRLSAQGDQIEALKALVCASNPGATVCKQ